MRLTLPILTSFSRTGNQFGSILDHLGPSLGHLGRSWAHLWPILGLSGASLGQSWGRLGAMLRHLRLIWKASWVIFCHLRAPSHLNRPFWTHLGPSWNRLGPFLSCLAPCGQISKPILNHLGAHVGTSSSLNPPTVRKYQKGGRRCIAAGVFDQLTKSTEPV